MSPGGVAAPAVPCLIHPPAPRARLRLLAFHHAGGGASSFFPWRGRFGADVDVLAVQLPGRENRMHEPPARTMAELIDELDEQLGPLLDEPYALYGHSMGALVAFEFARRRHRSGRRGPELLVAGACAPPDRTAHLARAARGSDSVLVELLRVTGTPRTLLNHPEWLRMELALLRADLRLTGQRATDDAGGPALSCPIDVFAGTRDPVVPASATDGWARHTTAAQRTRRLDGGHFFHQEPATAPAFFAGMNAVLGASPIPRLQQDFETVSRKCLVNTPVDHSTE